MNKARETFERRRDRTRSSLRRKAEGRARLSVHRTSQHIYVQVIDDSQGKTLASASTMEKEMRSSLKSGATVAASKKLCLTAAAMSITVALRLWPKRRAKPVCHSKG